MADGDCSPLDFRLRFLFPTVRSSRQRLSTWNPLAFVAAIRGILRDEPDLLIVSLWRSCIAGILIRVIRPRTRLVVLIHNSVDAHRLDYWLTRWAMALSCAVWADSDASMQLRFGGRPRQGATTIPFMTRRLSPARPLNADIIPTPDFVFWGRLAPQKNLARAIKLFQRIQRVRPHARFTVIGPDAGELPALRELCITLGLSDAVRFVGEMKLDGIIEQARDHSFYLQTSAYEGMAMSVVEGMQLGLVPVVAPVGEVGRYCLENVNAVIVDSEESATATILHLLDEPEAYREMRRNAVLAWQDKPIYREAVVAECLRLVGQ